MKLLQKIRRTVFFLREYFFPVGCSICGNGLENTAETWYGLCKDCHTMVEQGPGNAESEESCDYCGKPLISEHERCLSCRNGESRSFDRAVVLFPYTGKYRRLLTAYKFGKNLAVGNLFAEKICQTLDCGILPTEACIVPVPPRPGKIRSNGWDQVEYLARLLEKESSSKSGPVVSRCLKRMPSKSQKELGRENRYNNLKGRIIPVKQVPKIAIVIDDVMTTGSTLDACAAALKEAGAEAVYGLCLFYD